MFTQINPGAMRQRRLLAASVVVHGIMLAWLLHSSEPLKLQPNSVAIGRNGTSVTRLFWESKSVDNSKHSSPDKATERYKHERLSQNKLTWQRPVQVAKSGLQQNPPLQTQTQDEAKAQTLSALGHGAQAGLPYGTLGRGPFYGDEIRPALPIATSDPVVYPWQLPNSPGNEVIEITIDERGEITRKTVLVSLGSDIDEKCLAALENWRFHPATRNGAPIPSKQDAIFPFKARG
jgi:TonB family protein